MKIATFTILSGLFLLLSSCSQPDTSQAQAQLSDSTPKPSPTLEAIKPYQATFLIFTHNLQRNFNSSMYHYQSEDVYLEPGNTSQIHLTKSGITWADFFQTLPFSVTADCLTTGSGEKFCSQDNQVLSFYLNEELRQDVLDITIEPDDQLLISFGTKNSQYLQSQINILKKLAK